MPCILFVVPVPTHLQMRFSYMLYLLTSAHFRLFSSFFAAHLLSFVLVLAVCERQGLFLYLVQAGMELTM